MIKSGIVKLGSTPGVDTGTPSIAEENGEPVAALGILNKSASIATLGDLLDNDTEQRD